VYRYARTVYFLFIYLLGVWCTRHTQANALEVIKPRKRITAKKLDSANNEHKKTKISKQLIMYKVLLKIIKRK